MEKDPSGLADSENSPADALPGGATLKGKGGRRRKVPAAVGGGGGGSVAATSSSPPTTNTANAATATTNGLRPYDDSNATNETSMSYPAAPMRAPSPPPHKGSIAALLNSPSLSPSRSEDSSSGIMDNESTSWFAQLSATHYVGHHVHSLSHVPITSSSSSSGQQQQQQQQPLAAVATASLVMHSRDSYSTLGSVLVDQSPQRTLPPPSGSFFSPSSSSTSPVALPSISQSLSSGGLVASTHSPPQLAPLRLPSLYSSGGASVGGGSVSSTAPTTTVTSFDESYRADTASSPRGYSDDPRDKTASPLPSSRSYSSSSAVLIYFPLLVVAFFPLPNQFCCHACRSPLPIEFLLKSTRVASLLTLLRAIPSTDIITLIVNLLLRW